jgi:hypothetical protein
VLKQRLQFAIKQFKKRKYFRPLSFVFIFASIGTIALIISHAAAPYISIEAESGITSGTAAIYSDATASGGGSVLFSSALTARSGNLLANVIASYSGTTNSSFPLTNLTNTNETDRWISDPGLTNTTLTFDLGSSYTVDRVDLLIAADTIKSYQVQLSDSPTSGFVTYGSLQTTDNTASERMVVTAPTQHGRYLRLLLVDLWNGAYGNSIWEIGAYGTPFGTPVPPPSPAPTPTPTPTPPPISGWWDGNGRPFSATSPFNTATPANTQWFDLPILHTLADGSFRSWFVAGTNVWYAKSTDPIWTFNLPETCSSGASFGRCRQATTVSVNGPAAMIDDGTTDHVLMLVSGTKYYEVWNTKVDQVNRIITPDTSPGYWNWAIGDILTSPGAGTSGGQNDGTRAANFSWIAGLITGYDIAAGKIDHALAIALTQDTLLSSNTLFRYPATAPDNGYESGPIVMGTKLGIPLSTPKPAGLSQMGSMVFDALQKYGAYVGDFAGGPYPVIYQDKNTTNGYDFCPFSCDGSARDLGKILPLVRIADYQP